MFRRIYFYFELFYVIVCYLYRLQSVTERMVCMKQKLISLFLSVCCLGTSEVCYSSGEISEEYELTDSIVQSASEIPKEILEEHEANMEIRKLEESLYDKYIIKYKDNSELLNSALPYSENDGIKSDLLEAFEKAKVHKLEQVQNIAERIKNLDEEQAATSVITDIDHSIGSLMQNEPIENPEINIYDFKSGYSVVTLNEAVNAEEFISGYTGGAIEYIQPDYRINLAAADVYSYDTALNEQEEFSQEINIDTQSSQIDLAENNYSPFSVEYELQEAHKLAAGDGITIALIDGGVDISHPGLGNLRDGIDLVNNSPLTYNSEQYGNYLHGTHVAGIIAQTAPNAAIVPIKVFEDGHAYTSDIIDAIDYAEENEASIVNCSWGCTQYNPALEEAMRESDMLFVCAAGNSRTNIDEIPVYPACYELDNIISVASLNNDMGFSYFSNYGINNVDIAAWGRRIYSTAPGDGYTKMDGTSMSAAFVTGAAALAVELGAENIRERILNTADRLSNLDRKTSYNRKLSLVNIVNNIQNNDILQITPNDDFDVHGYEETAPESWELFSSLDNVQVDAGFGHTVVLKSDGSVWTFGSNTDGQLGYGINLGEGIPHRVPGLTDIKKICAGRNYTAAINGSGEMYVWGANFNGQLGDGTTNKRTVPTLISSISGVKDISAGDKHTAAVTEDGSLYMWGTNDDGRLGNGTTSSKTAPMLITGITNVKSISVGFDHTVALTEDGCVYAWGANNSGQLGDGTNENRSIPILISPISDISDISTGRGYTVALSDNGDIYAWGANGYGQHGMGDYTSKNIPTLNSRIHNITSVCAGDYHTVAVNDNGDIYVWGYNGYRQLGDGTSLSKSTPVLLRSINNIKEIGCGVYYTIAIDKNSDIYTWGYNQYGQLGDGSATQRNLPIYIPGLNDIKETAVYHHAMAVTNEGKLYAWGENSSGKLGLGDTINRSTPTLIKSLTNISSAAVNLDHTIALRNDGTVYTWGNNKYGQLGDGTTNNRYIPKLVEGLANVTAIAAGGYYSAALTADGYVYTWGNNSSGQLGDGTTNNSCIPKLVEGLTNVTAIAAGRTHFVALTQDGTVYAWGENVYGQLGDGTTQSKLSPVLVQGINGVVDIGAGHAHTAALKENGDVYIWGHNYLRDSVNETSDRNTVPTQVIGITNIDKIAVGIDYCFTANTNNGKIYCWGYNQYGQLANGTITNVTTPSLISSVSEFDDIVAGVYNSVFLKNGTAQICGYNYFGQLGDGRTFYRSTPYRIPRFVSGDGNGTIADAVEIDTDTIVYLSVDSVNNFSWYRILPKYSGLYNINITEGYDIELYEKTNDGMQGISIGSEVLLNYPIEYYIKVSKKFGNGSFSLEISGKNNLASGKAFETFVLNDTYYSNIRDFGKLYKNQSILSNTQNINAVSWLCSLNNVLYFNANRSLNKLSNDSYTIVGENIDARYIVSDDENIYFSNWSDGGKIYKGTADLQNDTMFFEKVCNDSASWLRVDGNYLYYKNNLDNGKTYRILKASQNLVTGEAAE